MVKHIQKICRQQLTNCLSVFDHFVGFELKGLIKNTNLRNMDSRTLPNTYDGDTLFVKIQIA